MFNNTVNRITAVRSYPVYLTGRIIFDGIPFFESIQVDDLRTDTTIIVIGHCFAVPEVVCVAYLTDQFAAFTVYFRDAMA